MSDGIDQAADAGFGPSHQDFGNRMLNEGLAAIGRQMSKEDRKYQKRIRRGKREAE
jgi:hypothetical protein